MNDGSSPREDFFDVKIDDEKMMRGAGVIPLSHLLIVDEKCVQA